MTIAYTTLSDATTATNGTGNFDNLMKVVTLHLEAQFAAGRITGTDYATVYLGALQSTLAQAVNFTLSMEKANAEKLNNLENIKIPTTFNYSKVQSLSSEAIQKLNKIKPSTLSQASRISGVSPNDISVLMVYMGR